MLESVGHLKVLTTRAELLHGYRDEEARVMESDGSRGCNEIAKFSVLQEVNRTNGRTAASVFSARVVLQNHGILEGLKFLLNKALKKNVLDSGESVQHGNNCMECTSSAYTNEVRGSNGFLFCEYETKGITETSAQPF